MDEPLFLRLANPDDIPQILELERSAHTAAHWNSAQYRAVIESTGVAGGGFVLVIAEAGGDGQSLIGFLVARNLGPEWELENIVVAEGTRRQGSGERLLKEMIASAGKAGAEAIFLEVRESNVAARALYQKTGFRENSRRANYYAGPVEDAILCRLDLP